MSDNINNLGANNEKEKTRYSDDELQVFKELIEGKLTSARKELEYLQNSIKRYADDGNSSLTGFDDGSSTLEKEYLNQMASRQVQYIKHLENALIRIENKVYGVCRVTGKLISEERLKAVPHTTLSIHAKLEEKKNTPQKRYKK